MGIGHYIKEIGRGQRGAKNLTRAQAQDLFGQVLDARVSDLEIGAFCLAMRIKGETQDEMAGFLDATHQRMVPIALGPQTPVVIPSYNGARKLPLLTALLALLLAREGLPVLVHGSPSETRKACTEKVLSALGIACDCAVNSIASGTLVYAPTCALCPGLDRLLGVRRLTGVRNPAHSVVKLMNPCAGQSLLITSYTHPEYASSMAQTLALTEGHALLLRGTEGEPVAHPRLEPRMQGFVAGRPVALAPCESDPDPAPIGTPAELDPESTAHYIQDVLAGSLPVPAPIAAQVRQVLHLYRQL